MQRARCHQHEDSVPDGVLQGRVPEGAEGSFSCLLALWKSAVTQPILSAARPVCHRQLQPPELLGCSQAGSAMALETSSCMRVRNGGSLLCFGAEQLGALVCIPCLLSAALSSQSNRGVGSQLILQVTPDIKPRAAGDSE